MRKIKDTTKPHPNYISSLALTLEAYLKQKKTLILNLLTLVIIPNEKRRNQLVATQPFLEVPMLGAKIKNLSDLISKLENKVSPKK